MSYKTTVLAMSTLLFSACGQSTTGDDTASDHTNELKAEAHRIAVTSIIVDTHVDVPMRISTKSQDVSQPTESGDFDYPRAVAGGLNAPFMSIYTDPKLEAENRSREVADDLIAVVEGIVSIAPDKFAIALSPADVREHFSTGLVSLPMGMENGSPIEGDLTNLKYFYDRGIRYITLAHGLSNHISDSSYDVNHQWNGLSEFGVDVVKEMNRLGIMVDVSHVSDDSFWQVMDISEAPVIASHSSARHFTPDFERNMNDEMIKALAENGGVIQINFGSAFISAEANRYHMLRKSAAQDFMAEHPEVDHSGLSEHFYPGYASEHGSFPFASIDDVLDHFDRIVALTSIDHVGIGSDYDGVGDSLPIGLKDVSQFPNLIEGLLERGYSEEDIRKVLGENLLRVWSAVEAYSTSANEK